MIRDHHSLVAASSNTNPSQFAQFNPYLVGGIPTPLKNMKVNGKDYPFKNV
jgi:hypothetical protein